MSTTTDAQSPSREQIYYAIKALFPKAYFYNLTVASVVDDKTLITTYTMPEQETTE